MPQDAQEARLWIGGIGGMEADLVKKMGVPFEAIPAAGVAGVGPRKLPGNLVKLSRGVFASRRLIRRFRPDVMLFTGGYVAVPVALAGRLPGLGFRRPRNLLYVPDIEPGYALKALVHLADHIAVTADESRIYFPKHKAVTATGYPVRQELRVWDRREAAGQLGLWPNLPTLLVLGGSRGARQINRTLLAALPGILPDLQVVHATGQLDWPEVQAAWSEIGAGLTEEIRERYHPYPYLGEELGPAMSAADLVLSRAGASTLGELPMFGLPAVLVPYPYAWRWQKVNAEYLAGRGAAVMVEESELPGKLLPLVRELLLDRARLSSMEQAMRSLHRPEAASEIARIIRKLGAGLPGEGREEW